MGLHLDWKKKPPKLTDRQRIEQALVRQPGSSSVTFDQLWGYLEQGREDYGARVDPAGRTCSLGDLGIILMTPGGLDDKTGQPWIYDTSGKPAYGYFSADFGPFVYLAEPAALRHEMLHYLDWLLHRDLQTPSGPRYAIIGHGTEGDPMR
jgi:hypothetical protein